MMDIRPNTSRIYRFSKRIIDIIGLSIGLIICIPLFLIVALAIKIEDSKGKVFYIAPRSGLNNVSFQCFKFRSMYVNADDIKDQLMVKNEMSGPVFKMKNDPRVTNIGRFIKKTSIDELQQLINVWLGHMSLVGPRPLPVVEANAVTDTGKIRELVKPGITCIWQVSGRNDIDFDDWMKLDVEYVRKQCFLLDMSILLKTIPAVLSNRGAS